MSIRALMPLMAIGVIACIATSASAEVNEPETYSRLKLSVGGYYYQGNVNQIQGNFQGHYGLSSPTAGVDLLFNGYRLWAKPDADSGFEVKGDDLYATALPFWYFKSRFYLAGLGRFESSKSIRLNSRYMAGVGLGYTPARSKNFLIRCSILPTYEVAQFDGDDFRIDIPHEGSSRTVFRTAILSNGWYRVKESPVSFRYFAQIWPNPLTPKDFRLNFNGNMDVKITAVLAFRTSFFVTNDSAGLTGREPTDVRSTFGFVLNVK